MRMIAPIGLAGPRPASRPHDYSRCGLPAHRHASPQPTCSLAPDVLPARISPLANLSPVAMTTTFLAPVRHVLKVSGEKDIAPRPSSLRASKRWIACWVTCWQRDATPSQAGTVCTPAGVRVRGRQTMGYVLKREGLDRALEGLPTVRTGQAGRWARAASPTWTWCATTS